KTRGEFRAHRVPCPVVLCPAVDQYQCDRPIGGPGLGHSQCCTVRRADSTLRLRDRLLRAHVTGSRNDLRQGAVPGRPSSRSSRRNGTIFLLPTRVGPCSSTQCSSFSSRASRWTAASGSWQGPAEAPRNRGAVSPPVRSSEPALSRPGVHHTTEPDR